MWHTIFIIIFIPFSFPFEISYFLYFVYCSVFDSLLRFVALSALFNWALILYISLWISDFMIGLRHSKKLPAFFKWLQNHFRNVRKLFISFSLSLSAYPQFPFSCFFSQIMQIRWLRIKLIEEIKTFQKLFYVRNLIQLTRLRRQKKQTRRAGAGSVSGKGYRSNWVRRLMLTLWSSFLLFYFIIIRLNYRKFEMIFKRGNWQLPALCSFSLSPSLYLSISSLLALSALSRDFRNSH